MEQIVVYIPDYISVYHMINKATIFGFEAKQSGAGIGAFTSGNDRMLIVPDSGQYIFVADGFDYHMDDDYDVIHSWLKKASNNETEKQTNVLKQTNELNSELDVSEEELRDRLSAIIDELEYLLDLAKEGFDS